MRAAIACAAFVCPGALAFASIPAGSAPATVVVTAVAETEPVGTANSDAADDPAIWRNPRNPGQSLIIGTDKKAGLHVYSLEGRSLHFVPDGRLNNVDLLDLGPDGVIVVASDRNDEANALLRLYRLDTRKARLLPISDIAGGAGEAYGICLMRAARNLHAFSVLKNGAIHEIRIRLRGNEAEGKIIRSFQTATQPEGCVVDSRTSTLYVGEEGRGIWSFDLRHSASNEGRLVAEVDGRHLFADVEGLALAPEGRRGGLLVASSQGDNAYALYRLPDMKPAGRFRIAAGEFGSTEETDGIALAMGNFGKSYPGGLFVAQDGDNAPRAQNFKIVSWRSILRALAD